MKHLFDISLAKLAEAQAEVREQLVAAQLREHPDSLILTHGEMLSRWLDFDKVPHVLSREKWLKVNEWTYDEGSDLFEVARDYGHYVDKARARYIQEVLQSIAIAHQHPCVVFYECGKRDDGTYAWRGARYGVEGSQYASGFGRF